MRTLVGIHCGNAHFSEDLAHTLRQRFQRVLDRLIFTVDLFERTVAEHLLQRFKRQVRIHGIRTVPNERTKVVHLSGLGCLENNPYLSAPRTLYQVMMYGSGGQKH